MTVKFLPLLQQPLFQCHFVLSRSFFLDVPPLGSVNPPLLPPPPSLFPPTSVAVTVPAPFLFFSNSGTLAMCNFYLPHSSTLRTHGQTVSSVFVKKQNPKNTLFSSANFKPTCPTQFLASLLCNLLAGLC